MSQVWSEAIEAYSRTQRKGAKGVVVGDLKHAALLAAAYCIHWANVRMNRSYVVKQSRMQMMQLDVFLGEYTSNALHSP